MARHPWVRGDGRFCARRRGREPGALRFAVEALEARTLLTAVNVLSYHNDAASTGENLSETALTPANVNTTTFGKLFSTPVDGQVYAQPLYVSGVNITTGPQPGTHNVSYVATEHDSLYAIDADTGYVLWQDSFLVPEAALTAGGNTVLCTTVPDADVGTNNVQPEIGITSTPAIDLNSGFLYLTAKTKQVVNGDTSNPHYVYTLYKVNIQNGQFTGAVIADTSYQASTDTYTFNSGPSVPDPGGNGDGVTNLNGQNVVIFDVLRQMDRTAVTLNAGNVFIGFASHASIRPYHGWILGFNENSLSPTAVFCTTPDGDEGGIWMGGGKILVDAQGYMYVETGNGLFDGTLNAQGFPINGDYGDSFIKLAIDPTTTANNPGINGWGMKVVDYFTPSNQQTLNFEDLDLGSGGPMLLPTTAGSVTIGSAAHPDLLIGAGKIGVIYVIDTSDMGHYTSGGPDQVVQELTAMTSGGSYNTPAFYFDGTTARIYYLSSNDNARSFTIANANLTLDTLSPDSFALHAGSASISANGTTNGIAWGIDPGAEGASQLRAYNASNLGQELWTSAQAAGSRDALPTGNKFSAPTVTNGQVFVGTNNSLVVYGEFPSVSVPPAAPSNLTAAVLSGTQVNLSWQNHANNEAGFAIEDSTNGGSTWPQVASVGTNTTSYVLGGLQPAASYGFRVRAFNAAGNSADSNVVSATTVPVSPAIDFSGGFGSASGLTLNGTTTMITGSSLQLTNASTNEASSAFSTSKVNVQRFITSFTFQQTNPNAEGLTFTIQGVGPTALGSAGGSLGYGGITSSVALKFDLNSNNGEGTDSTGVFTNGSTPTNPGSVDMSQSFVYLHTGDIMLVSLQYDGATLQETITDTVSRASFSQNYTINIPNIVGGTTAYVGFTAATGSQTAVQDILSWSFTPLPPDFAYGTPGNDIITLTQDADAQHIDWAMAGSAGQVLITDANGLTIYGSGGSDTISLNYGASNNADPLPNTLHLNGTFTINGLSSSNPLANTTLEIGRSTIFINYSGSTSPLASIQSYLRNGYNGGGWNGSPTGNTGVITSIPAAQNGAQTTAIGYADSADHLIAGQPANTIELKYTLYGDTSLLGSVGFNDFTRLTQHYNQTAGGTWDTGDFNYDGSINFGDFTLMTRTYNTSVGSQASPAVAAVGAATSAPSIAWPQPTAVQPTSTANKSAAPPVVQVKPSPVVHHANPPKQHKKHRW